MSKQKRKKQLMYEQVRVAESQRALLERAVNLMDESSEKPPIILREPKGIRKLSEIILEFAKPLLDNSDGDFHSSKSAIMIAILSWNIALLNPLKRSAELRTMLKKSKDSGNSGLMFEPIIKSMINRKLSLYPEINRMALDFEVIETGNGLHLNVVSSVLDENNVEQVESGEARSTRNFVPVSAQTSRI